jgi:hypothetical protein
VSTLGATVDTGRDERGGRTVTLYRVKTFEPSHTAEVGWIDDGYFYAIYEQGKAVPESHGGLDNPIRSLYELMTVTWREIDWKAERPAAARLHREGNNDQRQIAEFFAEFATTS